MTEQPIERDTDETGDEDLTQVQPEEYPEPENGRQDDEVGDDGDS